MRRIHSPVLLANVEDARARAFVVLFTCDAFARSILISLVPLQAYELLGAAQLVSVVYFLVGVRGPRRQPDGARHPASGQAPMGPDDRRRRADGERAPVRAGNQGVAGCRPRPAGAGDGHARRRHQPLPAGSHPAPRGSITSSRAGSCLPAARSRWARGSASICIATWRRTSPTSWRRSPRCAMLTFFWTLAACRQPEPAGGGGAAAEPAPLRVSVSSPSRAWCCPGCWRSAATAGG